MFLVRGDVPALCVHTDCPLEKCPATCVLLTEADELRNLDHKLSAKSFEDDEHVASVADREHIVPMVQELQFLLCVPVDARILL